MPGKTNKRQLEVVDPMKETKVFELHRQYGACLVIAASYTA